MRRIILFFVILISSISLYSQEIIWEKRISLDDTSSFYGANLQIKNDSSIYICGGVDFPNPEMGYSSSFIARLDIAGNVKWHHIFRKSNPIWPSLVHFDEESISFIGQYVITWYGGFFLGWVPFVSRFDKNGNLLFENFDSTNFEYMAKFQSSDILVNSENQILMATHPKLEDTLQISVFDSDGYSIYGKQIDTAMQEIKSIRASRIISGHDKYLIVGTGTISNNKVLQTLYVLNRSFERLEKKYFNSFREKETILNISKTNDDNLILISKNYTFNDTNANRHIIRKLNESYETVKELIYGSPNANDYLNGLLIDKNDDIYFYGYTTINDVRFFKLIKISKYFEIIWEKTWGKDEKSNRNISDLKIDHNNDIFIIGRYGDSIYLAKIKDLTVDVPYASIVCDIQISPNPATDYIEINLAQWTPLSKWSTSVSEIKIYDVLGNVVLSTGTLFLRKQVSSEQRSSSTGSFNEIPVQVGNDSQDIRLDVSSLAAGVYFVRVGGQVLKFVKM